MAECTGAAPLSSASWSRLARRGSEQESRDSEDGDALARAVLNEPSPFESRRPSEIVQAAIGAGARAACIGAACFPARAALQQIV